MFLKICTIIGLINLAGVGVICVWLVGTTMLDSIRFLVRESAKIRERKRAK
jgi:hypothetical protein